MLQRSSGQQPHGGQHGDDAQLHTYAWSWLCSQEPMVLVGLQLAMDASRICTYSTIFCHASQEVLLRNSAQDYSEAWLLIA